MGVEAWQLLGFQSQIAGVINKYKQGDIPDVSFGKNRNSQHFQKSVLNINFLNKLIKYQNSMFYL